MASERFTLAHPSDRRARAPLAAGSRQASLDELSAAGFTVSPGVMGENITTRGLDLLALPTGTLLEIGASAILEVTGLRTPCAQLDGIQAGLMSATLARDAEGNLVRKAGIMAIVLAGGLVQAGDTIRVVLPPPPCSALKPV